jgi:uncharacterized DUF497 family protein
MQNRSGSSATLDERCIAMELTFEWDEEKDKSNRRKHGVSFDEAKTVFNDPRSITISDDQHSDEEDRYIDIWMSSRYRDVFARPADRRFVHRPATEHSDYQLPQGNQIRTQSL